MSWTPGYAVPTPDSSVGSDELFTPEDKTKLDSITLSALITTIGTAASPLTDSETARPSVSGPVYWLMANGVTPTNKIDGDLIWNADAP